MTILTVLMMTVASIPKVQKSVVTFFAVMYHERCLNPGQNRSLKYSMSSMTSIKQGNTMLRMPAASMSLLCTFALLFVNVAMWFWRNSYLNMLNSAAPCVPKILSEKVTFTSGKGEYVPGQRFQLD